MNEDISNKDKLRTSVWQGSVTTFDKLVENGELIKGMIYFVGDSASGGLPTSSAGGIYVATSERKAVPFGSSSEHSVKEYRTASSFPTTGRTGVIYIASDTGLIYRWNGSAYSVIGGYSAGDGISIEGNVINNTHTNITDTEIDDICVTTETETPARNEHFLDNWGLKKLWDKIKNFFVQKENGKGLSTNDYTDSEKTKLAGIESGAEVNVQSDWNQTDNTADDYIKNKPSVYTKTETDNKLADKQNTLTFDTTPTANSTNPVTSGGIKTALDAKQDTISVTTNTTDPTDNDTIIMQANGVLDTTTFIRRKLSYLWNWIKTKCNSLYVAWNDFNVTLYPDLLPMTSDRLYDLQFDDFFYGAMERFSVTGKIVDSNDQVIEEISSSSLNNIFIPSTAGISSSNLTEGNTLVININPNGSNTYLFNIYGKFFLIFTYLRGPSGTCTIKLQKTDDTWIESNFMNLTHMGRTIAQGRVTARMDDIKVKSLELRINGGLNSYNNTPNLAQFILLGYRNSGKGKITKHAVKQDLYGEVEAPKFTVRGGTSQQVLLANGTTINMPSTTGTNKDTLLKNLVSGLTNATGDVTDETQLVTSYAGANGFSQSGAVNVAYKRQAVKMWNYIKSKLSTVLGINENTASDIAKKTNRVVDHTWNQPSYSASAGGTHVKICDIPSDCVCVMNVRKTVYGYPSINTLWLGHNRSLDFKALCETDIVATTASNVCTLSVPAHTASGTPLHTYDFEISVLNKDSLSAITWYDTATYYSPSRPTKPNIVMQQSAPVTDGSLAFNINSSTHIASVSVDGYTDFVGMLTSDSESAVLVKLSDEEEGSVYRFTFDHAIEGGVSFSNSNASTVYCEVSQVIHAGDTITLTAVSNTADGWIASVSSAGIISSDNSVNIEWENGVADLSVEGIPFNNLVNNAMFQEGDSPYPLAVGEGSEAIVYTGDSEYPYAYSDMCSFAHFTVDGGESVFYLNNATSGTTYTIVADNKTQSFTAEGGGKIAVIKVNNNSTANELTTSVPWIIGTQKIAINQIQRIGTSYYFIIRFTYSTAIYENSFIACFIKKNTFYINTALGNNAQATGNYATALGYYAKATGSNATALGNNAKATGSNATALGYNAQATGSQATALGNNAQATGSQATALCYNAKATGNYATALGNNAQATGSQATALGNNAQATGNYATALGYYAQATGSNATALGYYAQATGSNATALGYNAQATGSHATALGNNAKTAYSSGDSTYPRYIVKRFTAIDFIEGGETKKYMFVDYGSSVTISLSGNSITLTPPNVNCKFFIIVNDSVANRIYRTITPYAKVNGIETYIDNLDGYDIKTEAVNGNTYYALWLFGYESNFPATVSSFSIIAYYKHTNSDSYQIAIGHGAISIYNSSIAIGTDTRAVKAGQIVIGAGAIPNEDDKLIIGNGINTANAKKNIFTIDSNERVHARAYISDPQTYDTGGNSVNLGTITMGILKVTGGGAITFTNQNAVEGHCVKVYASGDDITCNGDTITAGKWREYLFLDGAWHSQM